MANHLMFVCRITTHKQSFRSALYFFCIKNKYINLYKSGMTMLYSVQYVTWSMFTTVQNDP